MAKEYKKGIFKIEEDEAVEDHTNTAPYRIGYMVEDRFRTMPICLEKEELITIRDLINQVLETNTVKEPEKAPMGVSQWLNHGKRYGYDKYLVPPSNSEKEECCDYCDGLTKEGDACCTNLDCHCHKEEVKEEKQVHWPIKHNGHEYQYKDGKLYKDGIELQ